ncbi:MAG TPA: GNAT family N-acetyltransferase [Acidimicrobiales bacterium]|nr:GNAT family N-acetyltransferase [Acidimicrobiales bacterium]
MREARATEWDVRPMRMEDAEAVIAVVEAANAEARRQAGRPPAPERPPEERAATVRAMHRFVELDPDGAWVAVAGDDVVGMTESIRRGGFWGLSMLFVDPAYQSRGVGRALITKALATAEGASVRMIQASSDPRALRRYSGAGLRLHPNVAAEGTVERSAIPRELPGRPGTADDLELVTEVDAGLGRARTADVAFGLEQGLRFEVVDGPRGRGFALCRDTQLVMLGATDEDTAAVLMWRWLAETTGDTEVHGLSAEQDWAVRVAHAARLTVRPQGALFVDGMAVPGPWVPSGWYF